MLSGVSRFARDVRFSFISIAVTTFIGFILRIFLARYLGDAELGLYTLSLTVYSFGLLISVFGVNLALTKYVAEFREDTARIRLMVSSGIFSGIVFGCAIGVVLYVSSGAIANLFFKMPELESLLHIVAFAFPFIALESVVLGFLNGLRRMRLFAFINITQNVLTIFLTVMLVSLGGIGVVGAIYSILFSIIVMSLFSLLSIRKSLVKPTLEQYKLQVKPLLVFGGYVVLANGITLIQTYTGSIMLGYFTTDVNVGLYSVATTLIQSIWLPSQSIQIIASPVIASYWGKGEVSRIEYFINTIMKFTALFVIPAGFLIGFLGRDIIILIFGGEFMPAVLPLQILLVGAVFGAIRASTGTALSSTAYVNIVFKLTLINVIANIIMNFLLIPRLGITGAAIATSVTYAIAASTSLYFTQRLLKVRIQLRWFAKLFALSGFLAAANYGLGLILNRYICISLTMTVLLFVLVKYFISADDFALIRRAISRK